MPLAVELHGTIVGTLEGDARNFDFIPSAEGIDCFGANSAVLSVAIPLVPRQRTDQSGRRRNWFAELLPEGNQYDYMLQQAGLRAGDTPGFLARYGRDVAGALQLWDLDDPTEPAEPGVRPVTAAQIRGLLEDPIGSPLANAPQVGKSSLGGVQPKIVLARTDEGWAQALGGHPTT
ncbi:MAG TPA: HipA N-terminal domain-containing protein, partial [Demequina sp.]|nr:HipA N-terminal domain-containing protein [Demequina sp.]